jgi:hypothetical protein
MLAVFVWDDMYSSQGFTQSEALTNRKLQKKIFWSNRRRFRVQKKFLGLSPLIFSTKKSFWGHRHRFCVQKKVFEAIAVGSTFKKKFLGSPPLVLRSKKSF